MLCLNTLKENIFTVYCKEKKIINNKLLLGEKKLTETKKIFSHFVTNGYEYIISAADICNPIVLPEDFEPQKGLIRRKKTNEQNTYKSKSHFLILMTLFYTETFSQLELFYNYYRLQGVSKFYMFYNGKIDTVFKNLPIAEDIEYIEWDFPYTIWEKKENCSPISSYAQIPALNTFYYKYSQISDYCILCDVDEFIYCKNNKLIDYLKINLPEHIYIRNCWAKIDFKKNLFFYNKNLSICSNPKWRAKCIRPSLKLQNEKIFKIPVHSGGCNDSLCDDMLMLHTKTTDIDYPDCQEFIF